MYRYLIVEWGNFFIQAFKPFVSNIKYYGLHRLRSDGTTAACNFGVPESFQASWQTEIRKRQKDGYVNDSFNNDMSFVSKYLGI